MSTVPYRSLSADVRERLLDRVTAGHQPGVFVQHFGREKMVLALLAASAATGISLFLVAVIVQSSARSGSDGALLTGIIALVTLPTSVYALVCLVELARSMQSRVQPFILVSPVELIRGDFDHGTIEFYRLADATEFHVVDESRKGLRYEFKFANDPAPPMFWPTIRINDPAGIRAMDEAVGYARAIKDDPAAKAAALAHYELIPETAPAVRRHRQFAQPFSGFWIVLWLCYLLVGCIAIILAVIVGRRR